MNSLRIIDESFLTRMLNKIDLDLSNGIYDSNLKVRNIILYNILNSDIDSIKKSIIKSKINKISSPNLAYTWY